MTENVPPSQQEIDGQRVAAYHEATRLLRLATNILLISYAVEEAILARHGKSGVVLAVAHRTGVYYEAARLTRAAAAVLSDLDT